MSSFDHEQFKESQRQGRNEAAAGWEKWWKTTEFAGKGLTKRMLDLAEIKQGSKVLDLATGIGEPSISAAQRVGKRGRVAVDLSSQMLSVARRRAISLHLEDIIEFREGDLETIDLPALAFDVALCRFGLMFLSNLKVGLSNIYRSLIDGGRFSAVVWASADKVPFISLPLNILMKELNSQIFPKNSPGPFSLSNENLLKDSFINSGFKDVTTEKNIMTFTFSSAEEYTNFVYETASPVQVFLTKQPLEGRVKILKKITKEVATQYADKDSGSITLNNEAICITART